MNDSNMCTIGTRNTVKSSQYPEELEDKRPSKRKRSRKSNDTITTNSESPCKTLQRRPGQIPEFEETNIRIKVEENYALKKRVHFQLDELDEKQTQSKPFMRPKSTVELRKSASLSKTLPFLLLQREQGIKSLKFWKSRMLQSDDSNGKGEHLSSNQGKNWRPYCYRRIPFTELGTPASDAILALDPSGSYMISVGGRSEFNPNHSDEMEERMRKEEQGKGMEVISLALRFYGLPLSRVHRDSYQSREKLNSMSPLLLTIPIAYQDNHASQQPLNEYRYNNSGIVGNSMSAGFGPNWDIDLLAPPPALFPIRIWTSSDGILGAVLARLWHHEGWIGVSHLLSRLCY